MEFDLQDSPTIFEEHNSDTIPDLFGSESDHMPSKNSPSRLRNRDCYISFRSEAISLILQAQFSCNFEPFISYLAANYLDRYVSKQDIPLGKPWISRLLVIACLSLAAKMKNLPLPLSVIQREEGFAFDSQTVQKMEILILDALSWRMRSVTPFSFLSFFVSTFELSDSDARALRDRASVIIIGSQTNVEFLEYKPSIIAASAILSACHELFPSRFPCLQALFSACEYVKNESLWKCYNLMQEMVVNNMDSVAMSSMGVTPMSVLERKFTDSEISEDCTTATAKSTGQKYCDKEENKRRRLSGLCSGSGSGGNSNSRVHDFTI